jgi:hypothetical protein
MLLADTDSLGKTIFNIVATYANHIDSITAIPKPSREEINAFLNTVLAIVRDMSYGTSSITANKKDGETELNRQPLVFVLMRDIVCPVFDKPVKNLRIKTINSPYVDGAKWLTPDSVASADYSQFPLLALNMDVENESYRQAFLFAETIKAHGLDPLQVVHDIFTKEELRKPFIGLLKLSLVEPDEVNNFLTIISAMTRYGGERILDKTSWSLSPVKTSQAMGGSMGQAWWYLGLIEKLLEPARGSDWSRYDELKSQTQELWDKIEAEKVKRGLDPLPMELLLRIQSEDYKNNQEHLTIQGLLDDNRVW